MNLQFFRFGTKLGRKKKKILDQVFLKFRSKTLKKLGREQKDSIKNTEYQSINSKYYLV